jgi:hypothetical protein
MTLDATDLEYLSGLVSRERTEARVRYEALRSEMLTLERAVDAAELDPRMSSYERRKIKMQLVHATNSAEAARARLRRAEGVLEKLQ